MKTILPRLLLTLFLVLLQAPVTFAQSAPSGANLGAISQAARRTDDESRRALIAIFGQVVNDPLAKGAASGGGDTVLASIFQTTNAALLAIAIFVAGYTIFRRTISIAHKGTMFDEASRTIWSPLRMVWGVSALVPTANGWSVAQLTMLWAASVMGIGTANLAVDAAAAAFENGAGMVMQPVMPQTADLARGIFESDLCMHGINYGLAQIANQGGLTDGSEYVNQAPIEGGFRLVDGHQTFSCGGAHIDASQFQPSTFGQQRSTSLLDWSQFDVGAIYKAHQDGLAQMQRMLDPDAKQFVEAVAAAQQGRGGALRDPNIVIQSAANAYEGIVQSQVGERIGDMTNLSDAMVESLRSKGWWMLGSWYQTFAMANTRLSDAVAGKATYQPPSPVGDPGPTATWQAALAAYRVQTANSTAAVTPGQPTSGAQAAGGTGGANSLIASVFHSPGQALLKMMTNDLTLGGAPNGQVNPLIRMKNTGDYAMGVAETALAATVALSVVKEEKDGWSLIGIAAKAGNLVTGIGDALSGVYKAVYPYVFILILAFFLFGVTLSVYLPMVPFVIWFGACLNWLLVVAEGVVAAPLWAMTHLSDAGEGLGQATRHGYLFMLNMCMRPFLMVIGFFLGGGILQVGGTFLMSGFTLAVANAQFDSITGLASVIAYFWVYIQLCLITVHTSFNVILLVPDQVIAWAGGQATARLGYDTHDQASRGFDQGREKAGSTHERGSQSKVRGSAPSLPGGNGIDG